MTEISGERALWRRAALPASVILNLFLIALIVGHLLHTTVAPSGMPLARALTRAAEILPPKDAEAFTTVIRRDAPRMAQSVAELRRARQELDRRIVTAPFDPDATRKALLATETAWDRFVDNLSGPLVDALSQVSPEGRRRLISATHFGTQAPPDSP
jgi:uncharacterized membrane protein